jgi:hypothetical protein
VGGSFWVGARIYAGILLTRHSFCFGSYIKSFRVQKGRLYSVLSM